MVSNQKECAFMNSENRIKDVNDIFAGEKLKLPTWLAMELQHRGFVEINTPDFLSSKMSDALKTDPYSIDLNIVTPYFFQISVILSNIFQDDSFLSILLDSFRSRLEKLFLITLCIHTPNSIGYSKLNNDHTRAFLKSLTCIEKKILEDSSKRYIQHYNSYFCKRRNLE
ncbi:hypothetical protein FG386_003594 [Cryptosporidium ryanae]|uniref:uncharacterized protein n=1 Tax=Cryptosporidium ryanae TaxID=515981 RepID=UPI00351A1C68|nr:hypothetical protein FG386_003594 [Cryptosporidium ryanae]